MAGVYFSDQERSKCVRIKKQNKTLLKKTTYTPRAFRYSKFPLIAVTLDKSVNKDHIVR